MSARDDAEHAFRRNRLAAMDRVRRDGRLSGSIRTVGAELFARVDFELGYAWPSVEFLVEKLQLSVRTVKMAVKALQEHGYFTVQKRGRCNLYFPVFDAAGKPAEQVQDLHLSNDEQVQTLHLSEADRCKKGPEQVQNLHDNRCKKGPTTPLKTPLSTPSAGAGSAGRRAAAAEGSGACPAFEEIAGRSLRERLGPEKHAAWFAKLRLVADGEGALVLSAPTRFIANYVKANFEAAILFAAGRPAGDQLEIRVSATSEAIARAAGDEAPAGNADARWLIDIGIDLVADLLEVKRDKADEELKDWLIRCGRDPGLLRQIIVDYARRLRGKAFRDAVVQRASTVRQGALKFGPQDRTREQRSA